MNKSWKHQSPVNTLGRAQRVPTARAGRTVTPPYSTVLLSTLLGAQGGVSSHSYPSARKTPAYMAAPNHLQAEGTPTHPVPCWSGGSDPAGTARRTHLLLPHHEQDVLSGPHGHRLATDADLQAPGRRERALQLRGALPRVHAALAHVGHHLPVPAARRQVRVRTDGGRGHEPRGQGLARGEVWLLAGGLHPDARPPPASSQPH